MAGNGLHNNANTTPTRMYTVVEYLDKDQKRHNVQIDNTSNSLSELREQFGLGDWDLGDAL